MYHNNSPRDRQQSTDNKQKNTAGYKVVLCSFARGSDYSSQHIYFIYTSDNDASALVGAARRSSKRRDMHSI